MKIIIRKIVEASEKDDEQIAEIYCNNNSVPCFVHLVIGENHYLIEKDVFTGFLNN